MPFAGYANYCGVLRTPLGCAQRDDMTPDPKTAFPAMRRAGIPERSLGDAYRNWWSVLVTQGYADNDELARFVAWYGKRKGESWNPARLWNVRNVDGSVRCRYVLSQFRSWEARRRVQTRNVVPANRAAAEYFERLAGQMRGTT